MTVWLVLVALFSMTSRGAQPANQPFIKGTIDISFKTRVDVDDKGNPNPGVTNLYKLNLNVANSSVFQGDIVHTPTLFSSIIGREVQRGKLEYRLGLSVLDPSNPARSKPVGSLTGTVPIDGKGVYRYSDGTLRVGVDATGRAQGFEKKFTGLAVGKPPKNDSALSKAKKQALQIQRTVGGKTITVAVRDYDKMVFNGLVLAAGPAASTFPDAQVNGEMVYDYERLVWYFTGVSISYTIDGKSNTDKLTGNIRWVESPQRKTNGEGEYVFDVRVNEPEVKSDEAAVFATASDESAFFESDPRLSALTGTMKYKDTLSGDTVTQSVVAVDLVGSQLTRPQVMNLCKLILLVGIVPVNDE